MAWVYTADKNRRNMADMEYPAAPFRAGDFREQLQYFDDRLGTLRAFSFPAIRVRVSVQAGWGMKSTFRIAGTDRVYPFLHCADDAWPVGRLLKEDGDGDLTARQAATRRFFPISQATAYEVSFFFFFFFFFFIPRLAHLHMPNVSAGGFHAAGKRWRVPDSRQLEPQQYG